MKNFDEIEQAIKAVCPIIGISFGRLDDKSTWLIAHAEHATQAERDAADALLQTMSLREYAPVPDPLLARIAALEGKVSAIEKGEITPIGV